LPQVLTYFLNFAGNIYPMPQICWDLVHTCITIFCKIDLFLPKFAHAQNSSHLSILPHIYLHVLTFVKYYSHVPSLPTCAHKHIHLSTFGKMYLYLSTIVIICLHLLIFDLYLQTYAYISKIVPTFIKMCLHSPLSNIRPHLFQFG
jgi:hypothetical protein